VDETHLKSQKVIKFRGRRRIFMIGFTKSETKAMPAPAKSILCQPFSKTIPANIREAKKRDSV